MNAKYYIFFHLVLHLFHCDVLHLRNVREWKVKIWPTLTCGIILYNNTPPLKNNLAVVWMFLHCLVVLADVFGIMRKGLSVIGWWIYQNFTKYFTFCGWDVCWSTSTNHQPLHSGRKNEVNSEDWNCLLCSPINEGCILRKVMGWCKHCVSSLSLESWCSSIANFWTTSETNACDLQYYGYWGHNLCKLQNIVIALSCDKHYPDSVYHGLGCPLLALRQYSHANA